MRYPMPSEFHNREPPPLPFGISGGFFGGTFSTWQRLYEQTNMNLRLPKATSFTLQRQEKPTDRMWPGCATFF